MTPLSDAEKFVLKHALTKACLAFRDEAEALEACANTGGNDLMTPKAAARLAKEKRAHQINCKEMLDKVSSAREIIMCESLSGKEYHEKV